MPNNVDSPDNNNAQPTQQNQRPSQVVSASWEGPLPPPAALRGYNDIIPNGAERILIMAEKEQAARISKDQDLVALENKSLDNISSNLKTGKWLGAFLSVFFSICAILSYYWFKNTLLSCTFIALPILSVALAIINQHKESKES